MHGALLLLVIVALASGIPAEATAEDLTFQSGTYANFRQVLTRAAPTARVEIRATLELPAGAHGRLPAVVVVHSLAGYRDENEGWQASTLRHAGFATLTYDSFAARGIGNLVSAAMPGPPPYPSAIADAFAALSALAHDPRIDPRRIAILGFSFGGEVAHDTAFERFRAALGDGNLRFAAHVAYYPAAVYGVVADRNGYTGAPVLLMLGDHDTLPVQKAQDYLAYAKAAGHAAPIELVVYRGANHGWTDPGLGAAREYPYLASTASCPFVLVTPDRGLALLVDGQERPFDDSLFKSCVVNSLGYRWAMTKRPVRSQPRRPSSSSSGVSHRSFRLRRGSGHCRVAARDH
jgi:dienelactone hydrolase